MSGCDAVLQLLVETARGAASDSSLRAHLENCPDCRRRLANERMLSAGLAASTLRDLPPPRIQAALLQEFRKAHKTVPARPVPIRVDAKQPVRWPVKWTALAAAAAILLAVFLAVRPHPQKLVTTVAPPPQTTAPAHTVPAAIVPAETAKLPKAPVRRRRPVKLQPPPQVEAPSATPEVATDFFEIPYTEPLRPYERADVFRMQMPRANMAVFGLPVTGGRLDSRVTADVLIGEDGVMHAIRFVR